MRRFLWPDVITPLVLLGLLGCGGAGSTAPEMPRQSARAHADGPSISDENVYEKERELWRMDPDDPAGLPLRDAIVTHHAAASAELLARGDYDEIVRRLAELVEFLTPADLEAGRIPPALAPLARWVAEHSQERDDAGRAMGALFLLAGAEPRESATHRAARERIERAVNAQSAESPADRIGTLIEVWEGHEGLAPAPEVIATLSRLHVELRHIARREAVEHDVDLLERAELEAPLIVRNIFVYLRNADLGRALEVVQTVTAELQAELAEAAEMQPELAEAAEMQQELADASEGAELGFAEVLERAQRNDDAGAEALASLTESPALRFFVMLSGGLERLCRLGVRRFPESARFPRCLATLAHTKRDVGRTTGWYAEALRLAPTDDELAEDALRHIGGLLTWRDVTPSNAAQARVIARQLHAMVEEHGSRWPAGRRPHPAAEPLLVLARFEMRDGNVAAARERLNASLAAQQTSSTHAELALLLDRTGQLREAAEHYRLAFEHSPPGQ